MAGKIVPSEKSDVEEKEVVQGEYRSSGGLSHEDAAFVANFTEENKRAVIRKVRFHM